MRVALGGSLEIRRRNKPLAILSRWRRGSGAFGARLGTRSLGILPVAMAIVLGSRRFLSFDQRQLKLADSAGLETPRL